MAEPSVDQNQLDPIPSSRGSRYLLDSMELNDPAVQLKIISGDAGDNSYGNLGGGAPIANGDIDNDGREDLIIGCPFADGKEENLGSAGQVLVIYGREQTASGTVFDEAIRNFDDINLIIHGGRAGDVMGYSLASGDIDGDGFDDIVISAPYADGKNNQRVNSGEVYVIYGGTRAELGTEIDLQAVSPDLIIYGASGGAWPNYDICGYSIAVGDVVGDGKEDLIISSIYSNPNNNSLAGSVSVITGDTRLNLGAEIDLLTEGDVKINGAANADYTGNKVVCGDVNGDTREDIIIGSYGRDQSLSITNVGAVYVVYGAQALPSTINLNDSADVAIFGAEDTDLFGYNIAVGDVNGDQYEDIISSAIYGDGQNNGIGNCGEVYVIYGSGSLTSVIDLASTAPDIIIYGEDAWDLFGYSIAAGNINNDQYSDFMIGTIYGDGDQNGKSNCGESFLFEGNSTGSLGTTLDPIMDSKSIFYGVDVNDYSGRFVQFCDHDGNGYDDIMILAANADGPNNARDEAGEFYLIYSTPPPVKNEFLMLMNGDVDNKTALTKYKEYIFKINVTNNMGFQDLKSVTFGIDPLGYNVAFRWTRLENTFNRVSGMVGLVDCVSTKADVNHDGKYNYSIDFRLIFHWDFSKDTPILCYVSSVGNMALADDDIYPDLFSVNNKLNFMGDLVVTSPTLGEISEGGWVRGGEEITLIGLIPFFNDTPLYYPPIIQYSIGIKSDWGTTIVTPISTGEPFVGIVEVPNVTSDVQFQVKFLGIPKTSDASSVFFTVKSDSTPPEPPKDLVCMADSYDPSETTLADNDPEIYFTWTDAADIGSGTERYYYSLENDSSAADLWTLDNKASIANLTEGLNTVYVWAADKVGNIGQPSECQIFVDLTPVVFENFIPDTKDWFNSGVINCSINVKDTDGFGVDLESIEYFNLSAKQFKPVSVFNYTGLTNVKASVTVKFNDGTENYIKFRAWDAVGNGLIGILFGGKSHQRYQA
jgi:hypothetical protein